MTVRREHIEQVAAWLRLLIEAGQVTELRAIKVRWGRERTHTESGFFDSDHLEQMAEAALRISPVAQRDMGRHAGCGWQGVRGADERRDRHAQGVGCNVPAGCAGRRLN